MMFAIVHCASEILFVSVICGSFVALGTGTSRRHRRNWNRSIAIRRSCSVLIVSLIVIGIPVFCFGGFLQLFVDGFDPFLQIFEAFEEDGIIFVNLYL